MYPTKVTQREFGYTIDSEKNEIEVKDLSTYSEDFPNFCIMSKDMATKYNFNNIFDKSEFYPEMLVVDEAHHARGHQQRNGEMKPTQFRYMIQNISNHIPHILFASATPLIARLMASVAPEVNTISCGFAPRAFAKMARVS